jgi:transporter family protein
MDVKTFGIALMVLVSWGVGSFFSKLATLRIGEKSVFWDLIGYAPAIIIYTALTFKLKEVFSLDKIGIFWAIFSGAIGSFGLVGFYILLTKKDASTAVPLTAIFPALTAILAFIFLKEQLTLTKAFGIILSAVALFLLSL